MKRMENTTRKEMWTIRGNTRFSFNDQSYNGRKCSESIFTNGLPGGSIDAIIREFSLWRPKPTTRICFAPSAVFLRLIHFLSIDFLCWNEKPISFWEKQVGETSKFVKTTWESILIQNHPRPPTYAVSQVNAID